MLGYVRGGLAKGMSVYLMGYGGRWGLMGQGKKVDVEAGVVVVEYRKVFKGTGLVLRFLKALKVVVVMVWS